MAAPRQGIRPQAAAAAAQTAASARSAPLGIKHCIITAAGDRQRAGTAGRRRTRRTCCLLPTDRLDSLAAAAALDGQAP